RDSVRACDFIEFLLKPGPLAVNTAGQTQTDQDRQHLVYAGFTWKGLAALGVDSLTLQSFPVEFREGARARAVSLGGVSETDLDRWRISDFETHLAVMLYARDRDALFEQSTDLLKAADRHGWDLVRYFDAAVLPDGKHPGGQQVVGGVHFGFSDS